MPIKHFYKPVFFKFFCLYFFFFASILPSVWFIFFHSSDYIYPIPTRDKKNLRGNLQSLKIKERRRKGGNLSRRAF